MNRFFPKKVVSVLFFIIISASLFAQKYNSAKEYIDEITKCKKQITSLQSKKSKALQNKEAELNEELSKKKTEIDNTDPKNAVVMSPAEIKEYKSKQKSELEKEYSTKKLNAKDNIEKDFDKRITNVKTTLDGLEAELTAKTTIFTVNEEDVKISVGVFNNDPVKGERKYWPLTITSMSQDLPYNKNDRIEVDANDFEAIAQQYEEVENEKDNYRGKIKYIVEKENDNYVRKVIEIQVYNKRNANIRTIKIDKEPVNIVNAKKTSPTTQTENKTNSAVAANKSSSETKTTTVASTPSTSTKTYRKSWRESDCISATVVGLEYSPRLAHKYNKESKKLDSYWDFANFNFVYEPIQFSINHFLFNITKVNVGLKECFFQIACIGLDVDNIYFRLCPISLGLEYTTSLGTEKCGFLISGCDLEFGVKIFKYLDFEIGVRPVSWIGVKVDNKTDRLWGYQPEFYIGFKFNLRIEL